VETFLLFGVLVVLLARWWVLSERYAEINRRIEMIVRDKIEPREITAIIKRVYQLEGAVSDLRRGHAEAAVEAPPVVAPPPKPEPAPAPPPLPVPKPVVVPELPTTAPQPAAALTPPTPMLQPITSPTLAPQPATAPTTAPQQTTAPTPAPQPATAPTTAPQQTTAPTPAPQPATAPTPAPQPIAAPTPPTPAPPRPAPLPPFMAEPSRPSRSSAEWESLVGGNWFNKLGILIIVIALGLFLGYAFPRMGPVSISAVALTLSLTMLIGGVVVERRERYVVFGRGLLAGGWAGLYFTTYAMQALDAAKVIHNPLLGAILLLAVATGMVVHSLRYREQALTGLAYFVAFATLAITQVTALSVIALIPLAASLLAIAYRFEWKGMALFSLAATYVTCASRGDNGAPLWSAQIVFAAYWLLFEGYDLLRAHRQSNHPAEQAMLPLNALGFGLLSYAKWSAAAPENIYQLAIGVAAVYLASTILRAFLRPPSSLPAETGTLERIFAGGFEGPITLAAASSAVAAVLKLHGQTVNHVLLAEGELLFLAGLLFRQSYPRRLAAALFASLGVKLLVTDIPNAGTVAAAGRMIQDWTPFAALSALLFYVNRGLRKAGLSYGYFASALVALIIGFEIPLRYMGMTWLGLGVLLFVFGWTSRLFDFRIQGYVAGALSVGASALYQLKILDGSAAPLPHPWISLALTAAATYAAAICARRSAADRWVDSEREQLEFVAGVVASAACAALLWKTVPADYLGPAWMALALVILELGLRRWPPDFRWHAQFLMAAGVARLVYNPLVLFLAFGPAGDRMVIGTAALLAYLFAARMFVARPEQADPGESRRVVNVASACGSFFVAVELWALLDPVWVAPAWALFAALLMSVGFQAKLSGLRLQGHAVAVAAFGRLFVANFEAAHRLLTIPVVAAAHYFESWRQHRLRERIDAWEKSLDRPYLYTAAGLIAGLLYLELRPQAIEVGWAILTLALLAVGRLLDLRDLRYQSYALAGLTFWRTLAQEFPASSVFASTNERIAAGALVTGCLFIAQLLTKKGRPARLFYSLLATGLATAILFHEVSGSMLTVAWGIEGAVLLGLGFLLRDRTLRLSGLALFLVCVGKLFGYDLRALETLYRIFSFFVLGVILVGVSWLYTRFRDQIQRYL
jgi:uncharacterized membrane protein